MHVPKLVCGNCATEMIVIQAGVCLEMHAKWGSYYKVYGDKYECRNCGHSAFLMAERAVAQHFEESYDAHRTNVHGSFAS